MADFNDDSELAAREAGPGRFPVPPVGDMPAGGARWAVPHHLTKIALINQTSRSYRWSHDEALRDSRENAEAVLRDLDVRDALETRWVPTTQLAWHLEARDETDPRQVAAVRKLEQVLRDTPRLEDLHKTLLWAVWFGWAGAQLLYEWDYSHPDGEPRLRIRDHRGIHGDSLVPRWGGDWGVRVNGLYDGDKEATDWGFVHWFTPREREAVLVHTHNPQDPSFYEPEMAGQIRGCGARNDVYWTWVLASNFLALAADHSERVANGIWIGAFDESNPDAKTELTAAISAYRSGRVILLPRNKVTGQLTNDIIVKEVSTASPQLILEMVQMLKDRIRKYITGSGIDLETSIGVGGDAVGVEEDRVSRVIKYDAERLAATYNTDLMPVLCRYNCGPSVPPPRFVFDVDKPNAGNLINYAKALHDLGGDIDLAHLFAAAGLPQPSPGDAVASKLQPMSVVAATQTPQDVPTVGPAGPPDPQQPQPPAYNT